MELMCIILIPFCAGFVLDLIFGDPHFLWHPVRGIGSMISAYERLLRKVFPKSSRGEIAGGAVLVVMVCVCSLAVPAILLYIAYRIHLAAGMVLESYLCYTLLAARSLDKESTAVGRALEQEGIEAGRKAVSMIVGRDTQDLSTEGVVKAAVETVAENTSDGVIAPMIYTAIGGPAWGYLYKAVNTMDSMVGYKNDKYLYFGRAAAKTDDVFNFIPSRLSAVFMIVSSCMPGYDLKNAIKIYRRDRRNHKSPNAAQTESVMAGALDIQLAGDAWYFGVKYEKPFIGDNIRPVETGDIRRAVKLMYASEILSFALCVVIRVFMIRLFL